MNNGTEKLLSPQPKKTYGSNQKVKETIKYSANNPQSTIQYYRSSKKYTPQSYGNTPSHTQDKSKNPIDDILQLEQQIHFMNVKHDQELTKLKRENATNLRKIQEGYRKKIILLEEENDLKQDEHYNKKINQLKDQKASAERAVETSQAELKKISHTLEKVKQQSENSLKILREEHKKQIIELNKNYQGRIRALEEEKKIEHRKNANIHETQILNIKIANKQQNSSLKNQIEHMKFVHKTQMERLIENQTNEIYNIKKHCEINIDQIKKESINEVAEVKAQSKKEIKQKQTWFHGQLQKIKEQTEASKINEILKLRQEFSNQLTALKGKSMREMQSGKSDYENELDRIKSRHLKEKTQMDEQIKWLKEKEIKDKTNEIKQLKAQMVRLKEELQRNIQDKERLVSCLERKVRSIEAQAEVKVQEMRKNHEKQKEQIQRRHQQEIKVMHSRQEVESIKTEFDNRINKLSKSHTDEIGKWNQKLNFKNTQHLETIISIKKKHEDQLMRLENWQKEENIKVKKLNIEEQNRIKNYHTLTVNQLKSQFTQAQQSYTQFLQYSKNENNRQIKNFADEKIKQITKLRKQNHQQKTKNNQCQTQIEQHRLKIESQKLQIDRLMQVERSYVQSISKIHQLQESCRRLHLLIDQKQGQIKDKQIQLTNKDRSHELQLKKVHDQTIYSENQKFLINMKDYEKLKIDQIANLIEKFNAQKQQINHRNNIEKKSLKDRITALESTLTIKQTNFKRICQQNEANLAQLMKKAEDKQKSKKQERLKRQLQLKGEQHEISKQYTTYIKSLQRENQNFQNEIATLKLTNKTLRDQLASKLDSYTKDREVMDEVKILKQKLQQQSNKKFNRTHQRYGTVYNVRESSPTRRQISPEYQSRVKPIKNQSLQMYSSRDGNVSPKLSIYEHYGPSSKLSLNSRH